MKIDEQWECCTLCAIKVEGTYRGGEKGRHLRRQLVEKIAEGKTSYELRWNVKVTIKKNNVITLS